MVNRLNTEVLYRGRWYPAQVLRVTGLRALCRFHPPRAAAHKESWFDLEPTREGVHWYDPARPYQFFVWACLTERERAAIRGEGSAVGLE